MPEEYNVRKENTPKQYLQPASLTTFVTVAAAAVAVAAAAAVATAAVAAAAVEAAVVAAAPVPRSTMCRYNA